MTSPFFNEYNYIYRGDHSPLDLVRIVGLPVVKSGNEIRRGSILVSVDNSDTISYSYDETIKRVQSATRPVQLTFRQLHAARGVKGMTDGCRRFWQGFLRVRQGPGQWTGRFYVLQENSILACYPVKDVDASTVIETVSVTQATLIYGTRLQQFCAAEVEDAYECCFALLTLGMERLILRAESASAVLDWVSAFVVLFMSNDDLNITSSAHSHSSGEIDNVNITDLSDGVEVTIPGSMVMRLKDTTAAASPECSSSYKQIGGASEEKSSLQTGLPIKTSCILQGYLWKKCGSSRDAWERRWFILSHDCRLMWFMAMPSGAMEVPSGQFSLANIVLSEKCSDQPPDDRSGSSGFRGPTFLLVIRSGEIELHLRSLNRLQILSWKRALQATDGLLGQPEPILLKHYTTLMQFLKDTRAQMLQEFQNNPEQVLFDPGTAFSLIVGHEVGGCTKEAFSSIAGRFMLPLCDHFTADFVWDALAHAPTSTLHSMPMSFLKPKVFKLANIFSPKPTIGPPDLATKNVTAEPLLGEERVDFDTFKQYVTALEVSIKPSEAWLSLRLKLGLHPLEILIAQEDAALIPQLDLESRVPVLSMISRSATSYGTGIGEVSLFLTDRHLLFRVTLSPVVKVIPLDSLESVCKSELSNLGAINSVVTPDGVLDVKGVIHTISIQTRSGGGIEDGAASTSISDKVGIHVPSSEECPVETIRLIIGNRWHSRKISVVDSWLEYINELIDAHQSYDTVLDLRLPAKNVEDRKRRKSKRKRSLWSLTKKVSLLSGEATAGVGDLDVALSRLQLWSAANIIRCYALSVVVGTHETCIMMLSRTRESREAKSGAADQQSPCRHNQHLQALQSFLSDNDIPKKDILNNSNEEGGNAPSSNNASTRSTINPKWLYILSSFLSHAREMKLRKESEEKSFSPTRFREEWELFWDHMDPLMENIEVGFIIIGKFLGLLSHQKCISGDNEIHDGYVVYLGSILSYDKRLVEDGESVLNRVPAKLQKKTQFTSQQVQGTTTTSQTASLSLAHSEIMEKVEATATTAASEGSLFRNEEENPDLTTTTNSSPSFQLQESILGSIWRAQAQAGKLQSKLHSYNTILLKLHSLLVWADPERTKEFIAICICGSLVMLLLPGKYIWILFVLFIFAYPIWSRSKSLPALLIEDWWRGLPLESATHANIEMARVQAIHKKYD